MSKLVRYKIVFMFQGKPIERMLPDRACWLNPKAVALEGFWVNEDLEPGKPMVGDKFWIPPSQVLHVEKIDD